MFSSCFHFLLVCHLTIVPCSVCHQAIQTHHNRVSYLLRSFHYIFSHLFAIKTNIIRHSQNNSIFIFFNHHCLLNNFIFFFTWPLEFSLSIHLVILPISLVISSISPSVSSKSVDVVV